MWREILNPHLKLKGQKNDLLLFRFPMVPDSCDDGLAAGNGGGSWNEWLPPLSVKLKKNT